MLQFLESSSSSAAAGPGEAHSRQCCTRLPGAPLPRRWRAPLRCVLVHSLSAQAPRRALFADILPKYIYSAQAPRSRAQRTHITFPQIDSEQVHPPLTHTFSRPFLIIHAHILGASASKGASAHIKKNNNNKLN